MVQEFKLPDVGEGVAEGEIVRWFVAEGDEVEEDQPLVEVETDKALVEIPSPVEGTISELRAEEGEVVPVGEVIIVFDVEGEDTAPEPETSGESTVEADSEAPASSRADRRTFAAPHVRRLARELEVDLGSIEGSGPSGRITEADVRAATDPQAGDEPTSGETAVASDPSTPPSEIEARRPHRERTLAAPSTRRVAKELGVDLDAVPPAEEREDGAYVTEEAVRAFAETAGEEPAPARDGDRVERVPYRGLRRTIGQQMERSAFTAPHVTHHDEADATALVDVRRQLKPRAEERGVKLTYLPFLMKAVVAGLQAEPQLNAELDEEAEEIVSKQYYNLGFAVATDAGLLVPVVDDVDQKGLLELAAEIEKLAESARDRSIARAEMQGGTFTITNFGAIGGQYATPIINYPEVAILGLGAVEQRPRVVDNEVLPRHTLPLSLAIDHRVIDGAEAARFANRVIDAVENPLQLLLD